MQEANTAGNHERDLCACGGRALNAEHPLYPCGSLPHPLQPKMPGFALSEKIRVDTNAVVSNSQREVMAVSQLDLQAIATRMQLHVANRFIPYSIDFITNDRMHLSYLAGDGNSNGHCAGCRSVLGHSSQCRTEFIFDNRACAQGVQSVASLRHCLPKPH